MKYVWHFQKNYLYFLSNPSPIHYHQFILLLVIISSTVYAGFIFCYRKLYKNCQIQNKLVFSIYIYLLLIIKLLKY